MEHWKKKNSFSYKDLLYKALIFVGTVAFIVYFLPRDGKFNYQFDINKPWKYGQLMATFDFPIYKDEAVVKREQDSLLASFQPYFAFDGLHPIHRERPESHLSIGSRIDRRDADPPPRQHLFCHGD